MPHHVTPLALRITQAIERLIDSKINQTRNPEYAIDVARDREDLEMVLQNLKDNLTPLPKEEPKNFTPPRKILPTNGDKEFLAEIAEVCKKHQKSLGHEDGHGAFLIERYDAEIEKWRGGAFRGQGWKKPC